MSFLALFLTATTVFFIGDFLWLYCVMNTFFIYQIKHLMSVSSRGIEINYISAISAYIIIALGLTHFVIRPLLSSSYQDIFLQGSLFGFCMYSVYELTNHATLAQWPLSFVVIDILWGTLWCGMVTVITVFFSR